VCVKQLVTILSLAWIVITKACGFFIKLLPLTTSTTSTTYLYVFIEAVEKCQYYLHYLFCYICPSEAHKVSPHNLWSILLGIKMHIFEFTILLNMNPTFQPLTNAFKINISILS
jgi:hypothetical protein